MQFKFKGLLTSVGTLFVALIIVLCSKSSMAQIDSLSKQQGYVSEVIKTYTEILKENPRDIYAYFNRAAARVEIEEYQKAIEDLESAAKLASEAGDKELQERAQAELQNIKKR